MRRQQQQLRRRLQQLDEVDGVELVPLSTRGDEILDRSLQKIGGKGLFIKELEVAMQRGEAFGQLEVAPPPDEDAVALLAKAGFVGVARHGV